MSQPAAFFKEGFADKEVLSCEERKKKGIPVDEKTLTEIKEIANSVNVHFDDYFN